MGTDVRAASPIGRERDCQKYFLVNAASGLFFAATLIYSAKQ
jgi:hypothetical protein